jgi:hypothetical protein
VVVRSSLAFKERPESDRLFDIRTVIRRGGGRIGRFGFHVLGSSLVGLFTRGFKAPTGDGRDRAPRIAASHDRFPLTMVKQSVRSNAQDLARPGRTMNNSPQSFRGRPKGRRLVSFVPPRRAQHPGRNHVAWA